MIIAVEQNDKTYGNAHMVKYVVTVSEEPRYPGELRVTFQYLLRARQLPTGGFLVLPKSVADQLGRALRQAASGTSPDPVKFDVDENAAYRRSSD
jgi:hypothetical protein